MMNVAPFRDPCDNSVLWNAMINPLLSATITGALWYQGGPVVLVSKSPTHYTGTMRSLVPRWASRTCQ